ncbi:hypothetical protein LY76DRAFT_205338 [Colletotrichum caudatum]|nr:hypothetical protein LY76DRAFT_205338 [Colletotrichum caudatum]
MFGVPAVCRYRKATALTSSGLLGWFTLGLVCCFVFSFLFFCFVFLPTRVGVLLQTLAVSLSLTLKHTLNNLPNDLQPTFTVAPLHSRPEVCSPEYERHGLDSRGHHDASCA